MMKTFTRRTLIQTAISGTAAVSMPGLASAMISNAGPDAASNVESNGASQELKVTPRKGRIKQSASRWCYQKIELDELCKRGAEMGLKAIDLLGVEEWE